MCKLVAVIAIAALITGNFATTTVTFASSSRTGSASIAWEKGPDSGDIGYGGDSYSRDDRDGRDERYRIQYLREEPTRVVSVLGPQRSLGRLPETGGNYLIPFFLLTTGIFFLLIYSIRGKGNRSP